MTTSHLCVRFVTTLFLATLLAGCTAAERQSQFADASGDLTEASLAAKNEGLVIFGAGFAGEGAPVCQSLTVRLAQGTPGQFKIVRDVPIVNIFKRTDLAQLALAPGKYELVELHCSGVDDRRYELRGRAYQPELFGNAVYLDSLATFHVKPGEIVNGGFLQIHTDNQRGRLASAFLGPDFSKPKLSNTPIPERLLARLKEDKPDFAARMVRRPMVVHSLP